MNIIKRMTSATQDRFRKELIKRDQNCILSGLCHEVCDAAHLVNKEWIKPSNKTLMFTPKNGILLNSNLHKEFDLNFWTIDMNYESWEVIRKSIDPEKTPTHKCNIKLYPIGQKKFDTNMKLEIFNYLDTGIELPIECMPFIIKRNNVYKTRYITNHISLDQIEEGLKADFKTETKKVKKRKSSPEKKKKKKRIRYTDDQRKIINGWIGNQGSSPDKDERLEFCRQHNLDNNIFETRFSKLWKKYKHQ